MIILTPYTAHECNKSIKCITSMFFIMINYYTSTRFGSGLFKLFNVTLLIKSFIGSTILHQQKKFMLIIRVVGVRVLNLKEC